MTEETKKPGKIAITSMGNAASSNVDEQFGRCKYFAIVVPETKEVEFFENPACNLDGGAGPKAAEFLIKNGVKIVMTGKVGDKAEIALKKGGIEVKSGLKNTETVSEVISRI